MSEANGAVFKDGRIDRIVTWVVGALLLAVGSWMVAEVKQLRDDVVELRIAIVNVASNSDGIKLNAQRHEALRREVEERFRELEKRMR